ncbi:GIN domain-containing protein [Psychroserpens sp. NJDZ02]|uniref:GIN domain-containing protein n=1 Tax=Psychroserpens sp. NJDZ02 TaxID=2570561 RepID=UPI0010A758A5|nr:DUF2807 domain-containing protein [Psychroserpens sp. NJDZ02]QCE42121.1 hypothetical protein E9099_12145 [Psychroserpens sp. NJDZ02]
MTKQLLPLLFILMTTITFAQKKQKVKGSRVLTTKMTGVNAFQRLVLNEEFEVRLVKSDSTKVSIMTDDNLHEYIKIVSQDSTLTLKTTGRLQEKKLEIIVYYSDLLNTIELKEDAEISSTSSLDFKDLTLTTSGNAKAYLTIESNLFKLINNDKAKAELNITAKAATLELNNSSKVEALINASKIVVDLLESADAKIEGDTENLILNADNSSEFNGENLTTKNATVTAENRAKANIAASDNLVINASGTSILEIYGSSKITIEHFEGNAILKKK